MVIDIGDLQKILDEFEKTAKENKDYLIKLDSVLGDGDLGITMVKAFKAANEYIKDYNDDDIGKALQMVGMEIANNAAATMGTLIATGFMKGGKELKGKNEIGYDEAIIFAEYAIEGIKNRGKSDVGDKTLLDCLVPAFNQFKSSYNENNDFALALDKAVNEGEAAVEKTKEMKSNFGRAHYYGEDSIGHKDPGAAAVLLFLESLNDYIQNK